MSKITKAQRKNLRRLLIFATAFGTLVLVIIGGVLMETGCETPRPWNYFDPCVNHRSQ